MSWGIIPNQHKFLSTLSLRRATMTDGSICLDSKISIHALLAESDHTWRKANPNPKVFLSTLSLRRATRLGLLGWLRVLISIHALLAESDPFLTIFLPLCGNFYPRSPCGERRYLGAGKSCNVCYFYPRSPCGERLLSFMFSVVFYLISIHALLAESDYLTNYHFTGIFIFLSTLSLRRAT